MKRIRDIRIYHEDRLVVRWQDLATRRIYYQGKRVSKDCPLTRDELRSYVKFGAVLGICHIRELRGCTLGEALKLLNSARNPISVRGGRRAA